MSQQPNPTATAGQQQLSGGFSRIPTLGLNRSGANSRLPSPPVSPGLSSPSTPQPLAGYHGGTPPPWASGGQSAGVDRPGSAGGGSKSSLGLTTPNSVLARGLPGSRGDALRASISSLSRTPVSLSASVSLAGAPNVAMDTGASPSQPVAGTADGAQNGPTSSRSNIQVAVRVRPLCDKEKQRGDRVAWSADREGNVGLLDGATGAFLPKHRFDTVFGPECDNRAVAENLALPLIPHALRGVNGTIFAYGVTSSGKTHTMMGTDTDPGVVPRVIRELYNQIATARASAPGRSFSVRMSIMEIYNEVLNDLLDPSRTNLKVREDSRSGLVFVEGLMEQTVSTAEQALDLIARGDNNRKISATAFNEDSSRSHTITRIIVESMAATPSGGLDLPPMSGERPTGRRTTACLSLIDLAGSESARAVVSKGQRMEGSFINRSLLTLGTVIHKLAAGAAGHVPFRDSKLTRLLQPSLSGAGARVAVVCNITPAAAQSDETANTLKFAARAKLIQVTTRTNEILDERSLLRRYQKEVADLKRQLADARRLLAAAGVNAQDGTASASNAAAGAASSSAVKVDMGGAGAGFGVLSADEAAAAALQAERDARRAAEIEATMMKIKLERLQAFLEENGVDVDSVLLARTGGDSGEGAASNGHLRLLSPAGEPASPLSKGAAAARTDSDAAAQGALLQQSGRHALRLSDPPHGPSGLRHASSTSRLETEDAAQEEDEQQRQRRLGLGGDGIHRFRFRGSFSGGSLGRAAGTGEVTPSADRWSSTWSQGEMEVQPAGARVQANGERAPLDGEVGALPGAETPVDLRAQVAAALGAAVRVDGGSAGARGSASGSASGSDLDVDEDLNEGIMAQIRDMISEARLSSPTSQPSGRQPGGGGGSAGDGPHSAPGGLPHAAVGRSPLGDAAVTSGGLPTVSVAACRTASACSFGAGGPASVSSQHRRSATLSTASSSYGVGQELDMDLELQVLNADREVLHDQLVASEAANEQLTVQVTELRRQLGTYEQLTRHAASELAEIRRLKEAFQARLQRENDMLRAQLLQLGVTPAAPSTTADVQQQQQQQQQAARPPKGAPAGPGEPPAAAGSATPHHLPPQAPLRSPAPLALPQRYGVHSMEAFGSPAVVAPLAISRATSSPGGVPNPGGGNAAAVLRGDVGTPTRGGSGAGAAGVASRQRPAGVPPMVPEGGQAGGEPNEGSAKALGSPPWRPAGAMNPNLK